MSAFCSLTGPPTYKPTQADGWMARPSCLGRVPRTSVRRRGLCSTVGSGALRVVVVALLSVLSCARGDYSLVATIDAGAAAASTISPHFLGVNADWWLAGCGGEGKNWAPNASVAVLDLQNPKLRLLAGALAGGSWRIGGTHGDDVVYTVPVGGGASAAKCRSQTAPNRCYPICLSMERWKAIVAFAADAGLKLVFGLNMRSADTTNLLAFLNYTAAAELPVDTFELGNELGIKNLLANGGRIRSAVNALWPSAATRPLLAGPDDAGDGDANETEFRTLLATLAPGTLDALTFHCYTFHHGGGPSPQLIEHMMDTKLLGGDKGGTQTYSDVLRAVNESAPAGATPVEAWMGEGSAAGHGGRKGVTDRMISSFWYLNAMGAAATRGTQRFLRQALIGGDYELVNRTTYLPNPDFFAAVLWRRTVGTTMLPMPTLAVSSDSVRMYAACVRNNSSAAAGSEAGDVVLVALNFSPTAAASITLAGQQQHSQQQSQQSQQQPLANRLTWVIRSASPLNGTAAPTSDGAGTGILSSAVSLLGERGKWTPLSLTQNGAAAGKFDGWQLPAMPPLSEAPDTPIHLPPQSYAFSVLRGWGAAACVKTNGAESSRVGVPVAAGAPEKEAVVGV